MASIRFRGVEYPVDPPFSYREMDIVKRIAGVRALEVQAALAAGDVAVVVALGVIGARRAGANLSEDDLWDAEAGEIEFLGDEASEGDAGPPVVDEGSAIPTPEAQPEPEPGGVSA